MAAGLTAVMAGKKHVGLTRPYYEGHVAIGAPPGVPLPAGWEGVAVAVPTGSVRAAQVAEAGAAPVRLAHPAAFPGYLAAPEWALIAWGRVPVRRLSPVRHVLAVPPGENALLVALEQFLAGRRAAVGRALVSAAALESRS